MEGSNKDKKIIQVSTSAVSFETQLTVDTVICSFNYRSRSHVIM